MHKITFVSDRGSNLVKALEDCTLVHCFAHRLNNILKRTFYSAGTVEKDAKEKQKKALKKKKGNDQSTWNDCMATDDDPLMDYDDRDSSASESEDDVLLDARTIDLALRSLSSSPERDHVNVPEQNLPVHASQLLVTIVRCKQLCCYVKRVSVISSIDSLFIHLFSFVSVVGQLESCAARIRQTNHQTRSNRSVAEYVPTARKYSGIVLDTHDSRE
jgi:hypothetical protein